MTRRVVVDFLPEAGTRYGAGWTVVAIDVIRATTTAVTAAALGRRCIPVPTLEASVAAASVLDDPLLAGELGGNTPFGFHVTNSPVAVAARDDVHRPMILLSSSGTQLIHNAAGADALYLACLRNYGALVAHLAALHDRVAVIGAGTRGEFREEDQRCCALVAEGLVRAGFAPADDFTRQHLDRWRGRPVGDFMESRSVAYLERSNQLHDLDFVLTHINDLGAVFAVEDGEIVVRQPVSCVAARPAREGARA
jgi:2-phosphosulfolactate phosphatase